jgi:hypothetical protein
MHWVDAPPVSVSTSAHQRQSVAKTAVPTAASNAPATVSGTVIELGTLIVLCALGAAWAFWQGWNLSQEATPPETPTGMYLTNHDFYLASYVGKLKRQGLRERAAAAQKVGIALTTGTALFGMGFVVPTSLALLASILLAAVVIGLLIKVGLDLTESLHTLQARSEYVLWLKVWSGGNATADVQAVVDAFERDRPGIASVLRSVRLSPFDGNVLRG